MTAVVLDTNVLLDLWVFGDTHDATNALRAALVDGRIQALASAPTNAELTDVIARPQFELSAARQQQLLADWRVSTRLIERVFPAPWHCSDPKDQDFLDLAFTARAAWLITKDKALLHVARRARTSGLQIVKPIDFVIAFSLPPAIPATQASVAAKT